MAAPTVLFINPMSIPGLGMPLENAQLNRASDIYNMLPHITERTELQKTIPEKVSDLLRIIDRHAMGDNFRIHSLHRHTKLPANTIRLETDAGKTGYTWANATSIDRVDLGRLHPTFFKFHEGRWVAFEFAEGPLPIAPEAITEDLLNQVAVYMVDNGLGDELALELGQFAKCRAKKDLVTTEIEVQWSDGGEPFTICVPVKDLADAGGKEHHHQQRQVPTGWNVPVRGGGGPRDSSPDKPAPGTHWNESTKPDGTKSHKVHVDSNEPVTPELAVRELVRMGYLRG